MRLEVFSDRFDRRVKFGRACQELFRLRARSTPLISIIGTRWQHDNTANHVRPWSLALSSLSSLSLSYLGRTAIRHVHTRMQVAPLTSDSCGCTTDDE